jgi:hypothetical protein
MEDTDLTVTASSEDADYPKENAYDWRPFTWWKPTSTGDSWLQASFTSAKEVNYFAVAGHNLGSSGSSIKLQYHNGSTWVDAVSGGGGGVDDRVIFFTFDSIVSNTWRLLVSNPTTIASVGVVSFGMTTDLTKGQKTGFAVPTMVGDSEYRTNESDTGLFLGRSIKRQNYPGSISLDLMDPDWVRQTWIPFTEHAKLKPFFFVWSGGYYPDEVVFAWTDGDINPPNYSGELWMSASLKFNGKR